MSHTVLLADDDAAIRMVLNQALTRAGYEVRVLPEENLGWEENPPTLVEFIRRDLRWCQGNMQYWHFLPWPGLRPVSRYQLLFAILMFLGSPAWIGMLLLGTLITVIAANPADVIHPDIGIALFVLVLGINLLGDGLRDALDPKQN